jgi:porphobilinogen synthase
MGFPVQRLRRLRSNPLLRQIVSETKLNVDALVYPVFVEFGKKKKTEISSMPGTYRFSIDELVKEVREVKSLGIPAILIFGIPERKDKQASGAYAENGVVQEALRAIKAEVKDILLITDVCLCEYMEHGHCGIVNSKGEIENDSTLELLAKTAVSHAVAGADVVAPSDMMDGRVRAIRTALDRAGFLNLPIMSYSAKYASSFYGPFRDAAESAPKFGDRKSHQMNPANVREALREVELDIKEGADIVMVKPALAYLDVIYRVKRHFNVPVAAYNVSGEYSLVKAAGRNNWVDEKSVMMEILLSIKRAGADIIITYFAKEAAKYIEA